MTKYVALRLWLVVLASCLIGPLHHGSVSAQTSAPKVVPRQQNPERIKRPVQPNDSMLRRKVVSQSSLITLELNPGAVYSGQSSIVTVTLAQAAPVGGRVVTLTATPSGRVTLPGSITVAAGSTSATATLITQASDAGGPLTIRATPVGAASVSAQLEVVAGATTSLESLSLPSSMRSWQPATGTVTLTSPAGASGASVMLTSSNPSIVTVPNSIAVSAGQRSQSFTLTGASFGASGSVTVTASSGATAKIANTSVMAGTSITSLANFPQYLRSGTQATGIVSIAGTAPAGGVTIPMHVKNNSDATVPGSVVIAAGQSSGSLNIAAGQNAGTIRVFKNAHDYETYNGSCSEQYAPCIRIQTVTTPSLSDLRFRTCDANSSTCYASTVIVEAGSRASLSFGISQPYPGDAVVAFSSSNPQVASLIPSVTLNNSYWYGLTPVSTYAVAVPTQVTLSASCAVCAGGSKTIHMQVVPGIVVSAVSVAPSSISGGGAATASVTLARAAPAGGALVDLSSTNPTILGVPSTVMVLAGRTSASFTVTTQAVLANANVAVKASFARGPERSAVVQVNR